MSDRPDYYRHFRLNLEQQRKRAKDLLRAARRGEHDAQARIRAHSIAGRETPEPRLADAQRTIAKELRFDSWSDLKNHAETMSRLQQAIEPGASPRRGALDADRRTLHVRCGSDIREPLRRAGFAGDFYEHSYPYLIGPVRDGDGCIEQRAKFIVESYGDDGSPDYDVVFERFCRNERELHNSAEYDRVVIWSERDCYDQLVLVRLLGHYAANARPVTLELINIADFPGGIPFVGLGQLPPEALYMLWGTRSEAGLSELELGREAWQALCNSDPRDLARLARTGTPALPLLGPALLRHLQELPSSRTGLSLTQALALGVLAERSTGLRSVFNALTFGIDPLPGQGDLQVRDRVLAMELSNPPLIERSSLAAPGENPRPPWTDMLSITETGRAVLAGDTDFLSLSPPPRWVGGVEVGIGHPDWRWDDVARDAILVSPP